MVYAFYSHFCVQPALLLLLRLTLLRRQNDRPSRRCHRKAAGYCASVAGAAVPIAYACYAAITAACATGGGWRAA